MGAAGSVPSRPGSPDPGDPAQPSATAGRGRLDAWHVLQHARVQHGSSLAVVDGPDRLITYEALAQRAAALAGALWGAGVRRGTRVGVLLRNHMEVLEAHYACAALHAVVVNLNVALVPRELAFILQDCGAEVVISAR